MSNGQARTMTFDAALRSKWMGVQRSVGLTGNAVDGLPGGQTADAVLRALSASNPPAPEPTPAPVPRPGGKFKEQFIMSPNRRATPSNTAEKLVLHHCGGWAKDLNPNMGTLSHVLKPGTNASYHCLISWTGDRTVLVPYDQQAFHAGVSSWEGRTNLNGWSIGVAWGGDTVSGARRPNDSKMLIDQEIQSFLEWVEPLVVRFNWKRGDIITHRQIAPSRRNDTSPEVHQQVLDAMTASGMI